MFYLYNSKYCLLLENVDLFSLFFTLLLNKVVNTRGICIIYIICKCFCIIFSRTRDRNAWTPSPILLSPTNVCCGKYNLIVVQCTKTLSFTMTISHLQCFNLWKKRDSWNIFQILINQTVHMSIKKLLLYDFQICVCSFD